MNVTITEDPSHAEINVAVTCPRIDARVQRIVASLNTFDRCLIGMRDKATYRLGVGDVCYVETVEGKTFLYTASAVFETPLKLYELESHLEETEFIRASKQTLVNFDHVQGIKPYLNARLLLLLDNEETVVVSRQYAPALKRKIGL